MTTNIKIFDPSSGAELKDATGATVPFGDIALADDAVLTISAPAGWRVLVCNEGSIGALSIETVVEDSSQKYEVHHLKPHGQYSLGWSVYLEGDPGDLGIIRALVPLPATAQQ
ncbi:MAG: hypothetical protein NVS9B10_16900 [Nevskia sp.]